MLLRQFIADNAGDPDTVARQIVARFKVATDDADAVHEVTEQRVYPKL